MIKKTLELLGLITLLLYTRNILAMNVIGYVPDYRFEQVKKMDISMYTHVHFFSVFPDEYGSINFPPNQTAESMKKHFEDFKYQKSPHTKMIITVGGTSEARSYNFPEMASNPESRAYFIKNIVDLALDWEADGLDIDWEWGYRPSTQEHKDGYEMLMKELIESARPEGLLISNAISPSAYFGDNTPIGAIEDSDYLVVMSYSYSGGWSASSGHHSGLDKSEELGFNYWKGRGLDEEKIHVGIPFYGNRFRGASAPGQGFEEFSAVTHQQVQDFISEGYSLIEDDTSGSYIYSSSPEDIVFFDSPSNISAKVHHAEERGYGGFAVWEVGQDSQLQDLSYAIESALQHINYPPVIIGADDIKVQQYQAFDLMEGVTALDKKEGDITSEVKVIGIVDTYEAGEYPLTYIVKNSTGLSDEVSRTVEVLPEGICIEPGYIEWHSDTIYVKGDAVTYSNSIWEAKWWTQGDIPGNEQWGPWKKIKDIDCDNKP